jgi:uncharacterized protein YgbK (DUF1537 family)
MPRIVIIADDLSGAADCGIACTEAGLDTLVVLGDRSDTPEVEVLSVDADTRSLSQADAVAETVRLTRRYGGTDRLLFKKLDSTLRGHVGAELAAMLRSRRETGSAFIIVAPAFPATGRSTVDGMQLLHGTPLEHTEIWQREGMRFRAHTPEILQRAGLHTAHIALATIRGAELAQAIAAASRDHDAVVCDAETEADLRAIAFASPPLGIETIWAGSAGLARYLPQAAGLARMAHHIAVPPADGPILFVVGSRSRITREQVSRLEQEADTARVCVPPAVLRAGPQHPEWATQDAVVAAAIDSGHDVLALLGGEATVVPAEGLVLCHALAALVAPHAARIGALVSTGGETARAVLQALGTSGLQLVGEVEPGVPLSVTEGARRLPVVTKAGAFGGPDTLVHCRATLRAGTIPAPLQSEPLA